jgi:hypothetical protein
MTRREVFHASPSPLLRVSCKRELRLEHHGDRRRHEDGIVQLIAYLKLIKESFPNGV